MAVMSQGKQSGVLITDKERLNKAKQILELGRDEIIKIAGKLVSPDELIRFTLNACVKNPKLFESFDTREGTSSLFLAIITSRIMDIPCDGIHGYLVPFFQKEWRDKPAAMLVQFIPGYKGYVQLALRNPKVASINAFPVYENDEFDFEYGTRKFLRHKPTNDDSGPVKWSYAIWENQEGRSDFRVLTLADLLKRKESSKSSDKGPWVDWFPEMCAKTAILALAKVAPLGAKIQAAAKLEDRIASEGQLTAKQLADYAAEEVGFDQEQEQRSVTYDDTEKVPLETQKRDLQEQIKENKKPRQEHQYKSNPDFPNEAHFRKQLMERIANARNDDDLGAVVMTATDRYEDASISGECLGEIQTAVKAAKGAK